MINHGKKTIDNYGNPMYVGCIKKFTKSNSVLDNLKNASDPYNIIYNKIESVTVKIGGATIQDYAPVLDSRFITSISKVPLQHHIENLFHSHETKLHSLKPVVHINKNSGLTLPSNLGTTNFTNKSPTFN